MALKEAVPSFGNPFLRFYSPSIDSPLIPTEWCDILGSPSFAIRNSLTRLEEEFQQKKIRIQEESTEKILTSKKGFPSDLEKQIMEETLQQLEKKGCKQQIEDVIQMDFPLDKYESSPYAEQILAYLNPFFKELKDEGFFSKTSRPQKDNILEYIVERLKEYSIVHNTQTQELKDLMNVKKLLVPYLELDLPPSLILKYNQLEDDDPVVTMYQFNPVIGDRIRELGVLLDRYDTTKEILCILVWSLHEDSLVCLPSVGLVPYPLCWMCHKSFGMQACAKCGVAKYCSKECQQSDWKVVHRTLCVEMSAFADKHKQLILE